MFVTVFFIVAASLLGSTALGGYLFGRKTRKQAEDRQYALAQVHGGLAGIIRDFR